MIRHGLRPVGVIGEGDRRDVQLCRQPPDKGIDRLLRLHQTYALMAQQRQLNEKAQAIGGAAAGHHEIMMATTP